MGLESGGAIAWAGMVFGCALTVVGLYMELRRASQARRWLESAAVQQGPPTD